MLQRETFFTKSIILWYAEIVRQPHRHLIIAILFATRLTLNTAIRVVYPLLVWLAAAFAVDLQTVSLIVTIQLGTTFVGPIGGGLADRYGERRVMLLGMGLFCAGAAACLFAPQIGVLMAGHALIGASTGFYHTASHAYLSATTPYAVRGRVLGLMETSWALAALLGVSGLVAVVQYTQAVQLMYALLLGLGGVLLLAIWFGVPALHRAPTTTETPRIGIGAVLRQPVVLVLIGFLTSVMIAYEMVFVVYGAWLEQDFGASLVQLGWVFGALGFVELGSSLAVVGLVDRIGKRRALLASFGLAGIAQIALVFTTGNWIAFLPIFLILGVLAEFAIISAIILSSGLVQRARGTAIALGITALGIGRVIGSLLGPALFTTFGFTVNGLVAGMLTLICVAIGWRVVREGDEASTPDRAAPSTSASGVAAQGE